MTSKDNGLLVTMGYWEWPYGCASLIRPHIVPYREGYGL